MDTEGQSTLVKGGGASAKVAYILLVLVLLAFGTYFFLSTRSGSPASVASGKWCEGVNISFFAGGNQGDSFASIVYNGAQAAQKDLGATVNYVWSNWDADTMVNQFESEIAKKPDAIDIMGHPGSDALSPLVDEAERKGIIVTVQNVDLPDIRAEYTANGFGYVGQGLYDSGMMVGNGLVRKFSPQAGEEVIVFGVDPIKDAGRYDRTRGIIDSLTKAKLNVHVITIPTDVDADVTIPAAEKMFDDALTQYPNAKFVVTDHGALTGVAPSFLQKLGKKPGDVILAGFDLSASTVAGIQSGYIGLIQDQQPYLQGYLPILQSCLTKKYGFAGLYIDTGVGLIDNSNVGFVADLAKQKIR